MEQREAFYRWLANDLYGGGFRVMWVAAAAWVNQINLKGRQADAFFDRIGMSLMSAETIAALDEINAIVMAHIWTRLNDLYQMRTPLEDLQARQWDNATVDFEQAQNSPLLQFYAGLSQNVISDLNALLMIPGIYYAKEGIRGVDYSLGPVFPWGGSIANAQDRVTHGRNMADALRSNPDLLQRVLQGR
jgi:hypothetical protein